jgi:hypothetical protein
MAGRGIEMYLHEGALRHVIKCKASFVRDWQMSIFMKVVKRLPLNAIATKRWLIWSA